MNGQVAVLLFCGLFVFFAFPWIMRAIEATFEEWVELIRKFRGK